MEDLAPERRHRVCRPPKLDAGFRPEWSLEISDSFAEVAEEAEGLSYCNPSPDSFPNDKPPLLRFTATLSQSGAGRLKLATA